MTVATPVGIGSPFPGPLVALAHPRSSVSTIYLALGTAAIAGRLAENDLICILAHQAGREPTEPTRAGEAHSGVRLVDPGHTCAARSGSAAS